MLSELDPSELSMWRVYFKRYPFTDDRTDFEFGKLRHTIYEMHASGKHPTLDECVQDYEPKPKPKPMSGDAIKAGLRSMFSKLPIIHLPRPKDGSD